MGSAPLAPTGLVFAQQHGSERFRGSCFLFRTPSHAITAAHVVAGLSVESLRLRFPNTLPIVTHRVVSVKSAPGPDLAVMQLAEPSTAQPFKNVGTNFTLGESFMAYGYPYDVLGPTSGMPTARLFRGHYQRFVYFTSHMGYGYNAGELSIAAPGGLSGGPVFRPADISVTGLVTENLKSTTILEAVEKHSRPEHTDLREYHEIIQYGVSLLLDSCEPWLADQCSDL